jgi:2-pyrone-4,6-dicarboxylate lactonase
MNVETIPSPGTSIPLIPSPAGAVDAHSHIFGPFDRFPPRQSSVYALPDAAPEAHAIVRARLGVAFGVLTQPAPYGDDPSAMLDAIARSDGALRGVAVAGPDIASDQLAEWVEGGIVGLRFVEVSAPGGGRYPGSVGVDALTALAPRMREHGLHAQIWASIDQHAALLPELEKLGIPLVLDHMASVDPARGVHDAAFRSVADRLSGGDIWIKLVLARVALAPQNGADARLFHDLLLQAAPDRLLWGSDWPYVRLDPAPDAGRMLDTFNSWTNDATLRTAILSENPARLYGFNPTNVGG